MPAQMPQVDVTFLVDANGMLTVAAKEQRSGQQSRVTVQPSHGLTEEEVEQLVMDSVQHARDDFTARRMIELKNKAEGEVRHTEKALDSHRSELDPTEVSALESVILKTKSAMQGGDVNELQAAMDELASKTAPVAEMMMNAVVKKTLQDRKPTELTPENL